MSLTSGHRCSPATHCSWAYLGFNFPQGTERWMENMHLCNAQCPVGLVTPWSAVVLLQCNKTWHLYLQVLSITPLLYDITTVCKSSRKHSCPGKSLEGQSGSCPKSWLLCLEVVLPLHSVSPIHGTFFFDFSMNPMWMFTARAILHSPLLAQSHLLTVSQRHSLF